ncbi:MAG: response regulator [Candidatus Thalassarchaeaceae archaeon]
MQTVLIADEQDGRRSLLASSIERHGFEVTRISTLRQCEGTALATMPDVVLVDGTWATGDPLSSCSRLTSDPEFALKSRIVLLSKQADEDHLMSAAQAGISEVIQKPVDMKMLVGQLTKHANKVFVPPPAEIKKAGKSTGVFEINVTADEPGWALPILKEVLNDATIDEEFVMNVLGDLELGGEDVEPERVMAILRTAFDRLIVGADQELSESENEEKEIKKAEVSSKMIEAMEKRAKELEDEIALSLERLMIMPDKVAMISDEKEMTRIDPNALEMTRLSLEVISDLLFELSLPGRVDDTTLLTQVQDAAQMASDALEAIKNDRE